MSKTDDTSLDPDTLKRKLKNEILTAAGCGYGRLKVQLIDAFWSKLWPRLVEAGWTKIAATGDDIGVTYFLPKGVVAEKARKGRDFYTRIRVVIDRVLKRKNTAEKEAAELYLLGVGLSETERTDHPQKSTERRRHTVETSSTTGTKRMGRPSRKAKEAAESPRGPQRIDLSWKTAGKNFPKLSSRVGEHFQASNIPLAGSYMDTGTNKTEQQQGQGDGEILYDQIWDPARAEKAGVTNFVHDAIPSNKKEAGFVAVHCNAYKTDAIIEELINVSPMDGSDWSQEEQYSFFEEIFRLRKNIHALSKTLNKSICNVMTYYLGSFKSSDNYRLLKTVCSQERIQHQESSDQGLDACVICGDGGSLLICDGCEGEYHMACLCPRLASVPEGDWECDDCVNHQFLEARDYLIRHSRLYKRVENNGKKRKLSEIVDTENKEAPTTHNEMSDVISTRSGGMRQSVSQTSTSETSDCGDDTVEGAIRLRPSAEAVEAVRQFAECLSKALSPSESVYKEALTGEIVNEIVGERSIDAQIVETQTDNERSTDVTKEAKKDEIVKDIMKGIVRESSIDVNEKDSAIVGMKAFSEHATTTNGTKMVKKDEILRDSAHHDAVKESVQAMVDILESGSLQKDCPASGTAIGVLVSLESNTDAGKRTMPITVIKKASDAWTDGVIVEEVNKKEESSKLDVHNGVNKNVQQTADTNEEDISRKVPSSSYGQIEDIETSEVGLEPSETPAVLTL